MPTPPPDYDSNPYTMREYYGPSLGWSQALVPVGGGSTSPGGTSGQVQFNNNGFFGGLTNAQLTAQINIVTPALSGAVPASGGGTVNFLRADGVWVVPTTNLVVGTSIITNGANARALYDNAGILGEYAILPATVGGTNSGYTAFTGPATAVKTFTLPNSSQTLLCSDLADQTISGGANVTSATLPLGNVTIDCGKCPLQYITNNGAFTITAPTNDGNCILLIINAASAGAVGFSGFSVPASTGDALTTVNGSRFSVSIWRISGTSGYRVAAHQ